jgi:hypothetical protein
VAEACAPLPVRATEWAFRVGRVGYTAKALIYLLTGALALSAALGRAAPLTDQAGTLRFVATQPAGRTVLALVGVGLLVYTGVMVLKALLDPELRGRGPIALLVRGGELVTAFGHGLLGYGALQLFARTGGPRGGDERAREITAEALHLPGGTWLVVALAIGIGVVGLVLLVRGALGRDLCRELAFEELPRPTVLVIETILRVGLLAQGALFALLADLLARAAVYGRPGIARGPAGVLQMLARQEYGRWFVGAIGAGLIAIGISALLDARWRRFAPPPPA